MAFLAMLAGTMVGSLYDPLVWMILVIATGLAFAIRPLPWLAGLAVAAAFVRMAISSANRNAFGMPWDGTAITRVGLATVLLVALAFGIGLALRKIRENA